MEVECKTCSKNFNKIPSEIKKSRNNFCSRSCAGIYNNKAYPKRKPEGNCKTCSKVIKSGYTYCKDCRTKTMSKKRIFGDDATLADVYNSNGFKCNGWGNVRYWSRAIIKQHNITQCQHPDCVYDKHVQVCHKRPISDFPLDTLVSEVNSLDNLIVLCPNHHWEFDHPSGIID